MSLRENMSFREKMHWVAFVAMAGGFGFYFLTLFARGEAAGGSYFIGLLIAVTGFVLGSMTIAAIGMALRDRREAMAGGTGGDERDRTIHRRGTHAAYYLLVLGVWTVGLAIHTGHGLFFVLNMLLAIVVAAELVRIGTQLRLYRKGG